MTLYNWISLVHSAAWLITFLYNQKNLPGSIFYVWGAIAVATAIYGISPIWIRKEDITKELEGACEATATPPIEQDSNLPEMRVFSPRTPKELAKIADDKRRTTIELEAMIKQHLGSWITVRGKLSDASGGKYFATIHIGDPIDSPPWVRMKFDSKKWLPKIQTLSKGDEIVVIGKVRSITKYEIELEECELK